MPKYHPGDVVTHVLHAREHAGHRGLIIAVESYQSLSGPDYVLYHVRWQTPDGSVDSAPNTHSEQELDCLGTIIPQSPQEPKEPKEPEE